LTLAPARQDKKKMSELLSFKDVISINNQTYTMDFNEIFPRLIFEQTMLSVA